MPEEFDPYRKWLGIPPKDQPPHYYRLLGISLFEDDADVIENAANRQMSHVRTFQASKHAAFSQRILNELAAAKLCLLSPEKKPAYDAELKGALRIARAASAAAKPRPPAVPPPRPAEHAATARTSSDLAAAPGATGPGMAIAPVRTASTLRRTRKKSRRRSSPLPLVLAVLAIGVLLIVIVFMVTRGGNRNKKADGSGSPPPKNPSITNPSITKPQVRFTAALQDWRRG